MTQFNRVNQLYNALIKVTYSKESLNQFGYNEK